MFVCRVFLEMIKRMRLLTERTLLYSILVNQWFSTCALPEIRFDRWLLLEKQHFLLLVTAYFLRLAVVIRVAKEKWDQKGP